MNFKKTIISILTLSIFFIDILFIQTSCPTVMPTTTVSTTITTTTTTTTTITTTTTTIRIFVPISITKENTYSGISPQIYQIDTSTDTNLTYSLDLGTSTKDVYFVFTNIELNDSLSTPVVSNALNQIDYPTNQLLRNTTDNTGLWRSGKPEIDKFNENPFLYINKTQNQAQRNIISPSKPSYDIIGDTNYFMDDSTTNKIASTCRKVLSDGNKILNIWVADNCWYQSGTKAALVTQTMVDQMANKFLQAGTNNDIYDWITNIFGNEWGAHSRQELIQPDNEITILLTDIDNDNSTNGGVVGYFFSKDNFKKSNVDYSNERIMFYMDAVMFASKDGLTWELTDKWPAIIISTLAHEFQHMIHFYQKYILQTGSKNSDTWLNEMCSLVAEDFISEKLNVLGPRGVIGTDGTAGSAGNTNGRLPLFNSYNFLSVTDWFSDLNSYALNYAYGAYLARNFDGVNLLRNIVQNKFTDYQAITEGLNLTGFFNEDFASSLRKWGVSEILSDLTNNIPDGYKYNNNGWFSSTVNSINYNLGSINLYNYSSSPKIFTTTSVGSEVLNYLPKSSNRLYKVGTGLTGKINRTIQIEKNTRLTVVVR